MAAETLFAQLTHPVCCICGNDTTLPSWTPTAQRWPLVRVIIAAGMDQQYIPFDLSYFQAWRQDKPCVAICSCGRRYLFVQRHSQKEQPGRTDPWRDSTDTRRRDWIGPIGRPARGDGNKSFTGAALSST